jgi:hypothetical protein
MKVKFLAFMALTALVSVPARANAGPGPRETFLVLEYILARVGIISERAAISASERAALAYGRAAQVYGRAAHSEQATAALGRIYNDIDHQVVVSPYALRVEPFDFTAAVRPHALRVEPSPFDFAAAPRPYALRVEPRPFDITAAARKAAEREAAAHRAGEKATEAQIGDEASGVSRPDAASLNSELSAPSEATEKADPIFKFSALNGKLKIGKLKQFDHVEIEGGEINVYGWGAAGGAAAYCGRSECLKVLVRSLAKEMVDQKDAKEIVDLAKRFGRIEPHD